MNEEKERSLGSRLIQHLIGRLSVKCFTAPLRDPLKNHEHLRLFRPEDGSPPPVSPMAESLEIL
jgi:hypothetical protein